jgi:hypothetical protein
MVSSMILRLSPDPAASRPLFSEMPDHFFTGDDPEPGLETAAPLEAAKQVEFPFDQAQEDFGEDVLGVLGRVRVATDAKALTDDGVDVVRVPRHEPFPCLTVVMDAMVDEIPLLGVAQRLLSKSSVSGWIGFRPLRGW